MTMPKLQQNSINLPLGPVSPSSHGAFHSSPPSTPEVIPSLQKQQGGEGEAGPATTIIIQVLYKEVVLC